jgi:hypothetical protein
MQQSDVYYQLLSQHVSGISRTVTFTVLACYNAAPHNHYQPHAAEQRSTPYAVTHGLCFPEDGHNDV